MYLYVTEESNLLNELKTFERRLREMREMRRKRAPGQKGVAGILIVE